MPTRPLPPEAARKVEDWLRYYQDIGIRTFYRNRTGSTVLPAGPANETDSAAPKGDMKTPPVSAAPKSATAKSAAAAVPTVLPIAHGPSLFEAAERVTGDTLERISADLGECVRCKLHRHRNKIVFGVGNPQAELVFVGEGPGHDEDLHGVPFVGRAGQLLTQMIEAMGLRRDDVYIANVVKCRPPENRTPEKDEVSTCMPFLLRQIGAVNPKVIVCLGNCAFQALLGTNKGISHFRGQWLEFRGVRLMPTYHPAYLLRNPNAKPEVWADLKKVMAELGLKPPKPGHRAKS
jgi:uracil-DNA glycosylase family 4